MDTFVRFLYEFINQTVTGILLIFRGIIDGVKLMFNVKQYIQNWALKAWSKKIVCHRIQRQGERRNEESYDHIYYGHAEMTKHKFQSAQTLKEKDIKDYRRQKK